MQLPQSIILSSSKVDSADIPGYDLYAQILTKLESLLNLFLLERLLTRQKTNATQDLINVSQGMLELTLIFWKKKDRFVGLYSDFEWLACSHPFLTTWLTR
jgi:hypothetical protein